MKTNPAVAGMGEYPIGKLQEKGRELRAAGEQVFDFSIGDPREPTAAFIPSALKAAVPKVSQYPTTSGLADLRAAVAGYVARRFGVDIDPDTQVMPTSGSKEGIFSSHLAFVDRNRGDVVVYPTPGYPIYERGASLAGAELYPVALGDDFVLRAGQIPTEMWKRASLVWTCTPHNPAGSITPFDDLAQLLEKARENETLLLSDECYADLYDDEPPASVLQVAGAGAQGCLSFFSLSKRSGMTGYRSGAIVGDPAAIKLLKTLRSSTGTASPEFVQVAATAAWSDDGHVGVRREIFRQKRSLLAKTFDSLGFPVVASTAGIYLWIQVGDDVAISEKLANDHILVTPGRVFGNGGEGYIRLALVPTLDECDAAAEAVRECLGS
jgi:succinyldiaminopimelate transaminase